MYCNGAFKCYAILLLPLLNKEVEHVNSCRTSGRQLQKISGSYLQFLCSIGRSQLLVAQPVGISLLPPKPLLTPLIPANIPVGI